MPIKLNHYGAKTIDDTAKISFDAIATEILVGVVCGAFAYMGWTGGIAFLYISNLLFSLLCAGSLIYTAFQAIRNKLARKHNSKVAN